jgi:hypothetical protein
VIPDHFKYSMDMRTTYIYNRDLELVEYSTALDGDPLHGRIAASYDRMMTSNSENDTVRLRPARDERGTISGLGGICLGECEEGNGSR